MLLMVHFSLQILDTLKKFLVLEAGSLDGISWISGVKDEYFGVILSKLLYFSC